MEIIKKYVAYSHSPGFRKLGRQWDREPITIGEVKALPEDGSRKHEGVELLATSTEIKRLIQLNNEEAYPLRIAVGATDPTARQSNAARKELDQLRERIAEARQEREAAEKETAAAKAERDALGTELAELRDAVEAAEAAAREKEAEVEQLRKELAALKSKPAKQAKSARKAEAKG